MKAEESHATETFAVETRLPQWKTYRTRFLVKAKQLNSSLAFTDSLGRRHAGRKGDYLVESSDGVLSIASRQIFEDIYVSMPSPDADPAEQRDAAAPFLGKSALDKSTLDKSADGEPARLRRKLPQPCSTKSSGRWPVNGGQRVIGVQKPMPTTGPWPLTTGH